MTPVALSLSCMELGDSEYGASWTERMMCLLEDWGPFRLAMMEASCALQTGGPAHSRREVNMPEHILHGCQSKPLASYLKSLGILRLVSEQCDSSGSRLMAGRLFPPFLPSG